nr:sugar phosphate isomerase/epimerase family protein [Candidatus Nitrosarchaeum limnium]
MQGRLSYPIHNTIQAFPEDSWDKEFELAHKIGLDSIEWIFDTFDKNPVMEKKFHEINNLISKFQININSVCADYFMVNKLFNESEFNIRKNLDTLKQLAINCKNIGVKIIEIPLVDNSSLKSEKHKNELVKNLDSILPEINDLGLIIALETDLPPIEFLNLLNRFEKNIVFANYDTGNSASLGFNVNEELEILKHKIKNIHLKDRLFNGKTVPFGSGSTNFDDFFFMLKKIEYSGDLIIQGAREQEISPEQNCIKYLNFIKQYLDKY